MQIYRVKIFLFLLIGFIVSGCEDYPVYSGFLVDTQSTPLKCIKIASLDPKLTKALKEELFELEDNNCSYTINGYIHHVDSCSNPQVKSLGADFNGYVRLKISNNRDISIYRVQSDFKSDEDAALKRVIQKMKKEIF